MSAIKKILLKKSIYHIADVTKHKRNCSNMIYSYIFNIFLLSLDTLLDNNTIYKYKRMCVCIYIYIIVQVQCRSSTPSMLFVFYLKSQALDVERFKSKNQINRLSSLSYRILYYDRINGIIIAITQSSIFFFDRFPGYRNSR